MGEVVSLQLKPNCLCNCEHPSVSASSLPHHPVPYPQGPKHCQLLGLVLVEVGLLAPQHDFAERPSSSGPPRQGLLRQHPSCWISACMGAMGGTQRGLLRVIFTVRGNQRGHRLPDAAGPPTSDIPVANSGVRTHANSTSDLQRPCILGKANVGLSFLFSLKTMGQCCSFWLLGWTAKATTASWELIEK